MTDSTNGDSRLSRELGLFGAIMLGLGSILGTGVFVSIGIGAGIAGPAVLLAIALAALIATCNGISSAQLAARWSVSGGTYEYGYRALSPALGFTAGWMFLFAKTASAATAALGFAGYLLNAFEVESRAALIAVALGAVVVLTVLVLTGIRRSSAVNIVIVTVTILSLLFFILAGAPDAVTKIDETLLPFFPQDNDDAPIDSIAAILYATALMFVAYTGYGRIATLGEEVRQPKRIIPVAIIVTLIVSMVLYLLVAFVGVGAAGPEIFAQPAEEKAAPLEVIARGFDVPGAAGVVAIGAMTAMLGVLLNLILGLSRVLLAMGRRGDMSSIVARIDAKRSTPFVATIIVGAAIASLVLIGDVKTTWTFSAFTVLVYYAITNLAALRLSRKDQLYPRWIAAAGLVGCLSLAFFVPVIIWLAGIGLMAIGLAWNRLARLHQRPLRSNHR